MPDTLDWIVIVGLVIAVVFASNQWRRYLIRRSTQVMAKVIRVDSRQVDSPNNAYVPAITAMPHSGGGWEYEVSAEYTDTHRSTGHHQKRHKKRFAEISAWRLSCCLYQSTRKLLATSIGS